MNVLSVVWVYVNKSVSIYREVLNARVMMDMNRILVEKNDAEISMNVI